VTPPSAAPAAPLIVETYDGIGDDAFVAQWDALVDRDPEGTLFQRARWLARWDDALAGQRRMRTRAFRRDGQLVGVLVDTRELHGLPSGPSELIRIAGGDEVTDYLGPVSAPEDRADVAHAYIAELASDRGWDEVVLTGLAGDSGWHELFATAAAQLGLGVIEADVQDVCPRVDLGGGLDGYLHRLPGRLRQELVRKARKLARDAGPFEVHTYAPKDVASGIDDFLTQVQQGEDDKALFFRRPEMQAWFRTLADEYGSDGTLRVHRLDIGELPAAMTVSLVDPSSGMWGLYNSSFDPTLAALAPGMVLIWELIIEAAGEGFTMFDLLRGDEPYKYRFGAVDREIRTLTLVRR
jgi:CelD/BcsL family acetyltransferase involved in cellulose biosynthesis